MEGYHRFSDAGIDYFYDRYSSCGSHRRGKAEAAGVSFQVSRERVMASVLALRRHILARGALECGETSVVHKAIRNSFREFIASALGRQ